jgi:hypothetical protein
MLKAINAFNVGLILKQMISNIPVRTARVIYRSPMITSSLRITSKNQI